MPLFIFGKEHMELEEVKGYLETYLPTQGFKLYDYSTSRDGEAIILHITVDRRKYIDLNTIAELTIRIQEELEKALSIKEEILIDCISAGVEKELSIKELNEYLDEYVYVSIHHAIDKHDYLQGYLRKVDEIAIEVEINVSGRKKSIEVNKSNIAHIRLAIK